MDLPGLIVAPLTPFDADLRVDYDRLGRQIDYIVDDCGAGMITAAGVETQEYHYLSFEARKELIRRTIELARGRCEVAVGVSHASTRLAAELVALAHESGADVIQLLAPQRPYGGQPSLQELQDYFGAIAQVSELPLMLYLNPGPGADVSPDATIALSRMDRIQYIKESSRDLARVGRLVVEIDRAGHARYMTTMQMLLATLMLGGSGATMPPPGCMIASRLVAAFKARDYERASALALDFTLFPSRWMGKGLAPVMKAAMEIIGLPMGDPYPPFPALSAEEKAGLEAALRKTSLFEEKRPC